MSWKLIDHDSHVSDVSSQCLCLEEFSGQLTVGSQSAWEEWLAEDNDTFFHPLSKQAMAPGCLALHLWDPPVHQPGFMKHDQNKGQRGEKRSIDTHKVSQALLHAECKKKQLKCMSINTGLHYIYITLAWCLAVWMDNYYPSKAAVCTGNQ